MRSQFMPWCLVQVNNPNNSNFITWTIEISANVTFRGPSTYITTNSTIPSPPLPPIATYFTSVADAPGTP